MMVYKKIKHALAVASQVIIAAPVKLPPKLVAVAKYVALAIGILDAVVQKADEPPTHKTDPDEGQPTG